ncbi:hypothetical protein BQ8482_110993 [Mesorhizobium delmotii]|uniref:Uncharacterized protein n=1 Tax=Mesorhizobium delmotii TaxID=1631247 RepID=A0A2P9AD61_9HYPH|nr:hypothetical protein BQ8482_110993 [Mesorhizobium delmotii]
MRRSVRARRRLKADVAQARARWFRRAAFVSSTPKAKARFPFRPDRKVQLRTAFKPAAHLKEERSVAAIAAYKAAQSPISEFIGGSPVSICASPNSIARCRFRPSASFPFVS